MSLSGNHGHSSGKMFVFGYYPEFRLGVPCVLTRMENFAMKGNVDRRTFLGTAGRGLAASLLGGTSRRALAAPSGQRPPNFIVILADDLGAKELSCYGNRTHQTPCLDQLGETGVRFNTCYATPICHPTRLMIMTGQYGCHKCA